MFPSAHPASGFHTAVECRSYQLPHFSPCWGPLAPTGFNSFLKFILFSQYLRLANYKGSLRTYVNMLMSYLLQLSTNGY